MLCWLNFVFTRLTWIWFLFRDGVVHWHAKQAEVAPSCGGIFVPNIWKVPRSMFYLGL